MQATARRLSVVSSTSCARRRLIRDVRPTRNRQVSAYVHALLSWDDALTTLAHWIRGFATVTGPHQLSFDTVVQIMASVSGGFQTLPPALLNRDAAFIDSALDRCRERPSEVIVIPDCGMTSRLPLRLPLTELIQFVGEFDYDSGTHKFGLLDGASDIFFGFDTGDMLFVDHDERIWFTPALPTVT